MEHEIRKTRDELLKKEVELEKKQNEFINFKRRQELKVKQEELRGVDDSLSTAFLTIGEAPIDGGPGARSWNPTPANPCAGCTFFKICRIFC